MTRPDPSRIGARGRVTGLASPRRENIRALRTMAKAAPTRIEWPEVRGGRASTQNRGATKPLEARRSEPEAPHRGNESQAATTRTRRHSAPKSAPLLN
jgi:hypothetical protein